MVLLITSGGGAVFFTGSDLNDAEPGVYYVHYNTSSIKNIATQADGYLICLQFQDDTNNKIQYYCTNTSSINLMTFTRCQRSSGDWTEWDQVVTDIGIQNNFIHQTPIYEHVYRINASYSADTTTTLEGWLRFISTDSPGSPNLETNLIMNLESGMQIQGSCITTKNNYLFNYWNLHWIVQQYTGKFVITGVCMVPNISGSTNWYCYSSSKTLSFTFTNTKFTWMSSTQIGVEF